MSCIASAPLYPAGSFKTCVSTFDTISREGFAAIHNIPLTHLQRERFSWRQASLPIRHGGLSIIAASVTSDAAYIGSIIDTSDLARQLTSAIEAEHPYDDEALTRHAIERIQDTYSLGSAFNFTGLHIRHSQGLRQSQRFLSLAIQTALSERLFVSLGKRNVLHKAHLLSCREHEASDWIRAIPDPKFKSAISGALWNTMVSLRLLVPIESFCSYCADAGTAAVPDKYGHHALICRHKYGYTRRHNTVKDTIAQVAFRRCGMTVIHEPHNLGSNPSDRPDLFAPLTDTAYDITILSAYAPSNVKGFSKDARSPILRREAEKHKRYDARLATIGQGLKLLAFGMNHIGVLGDDAKKVIAEQATVLASQSSYSHATAKRILRTHISIALHSFNALSVNVRKRHPTPMNSTPA